MKLATTTGAFATYTANQNDAIRYIHQAGFRYADYNFQMDTDCQTGIALPDWKAQIETVRRTAEETVVLIHAAGGHFPVGGRIDVTAV